MFGPRFNGIGKAHIEGFIAELKKKVVKNSILLSYFVKKAVGFIVIFSTPWIGVIQNMPVNKYIYV